MFVYLFLNTKNKVSSKVVFQVTQSLSHINKQVVEIVRCDRSIFTPVITNTKKKSEAKKYETMKVGGNGSCYWSIFFYEILISINFTKKFQKLNVFCPISFILSDFIKIRKNEKADHSEIFLPLVYL